MTRVEQQLQLFDHIVVIRKVYVEKMNKALLQFGLSSSQWLVLKIIVKKQSTTLVEIAKLRNIEKPTATKIIQFLIQHQFIESCIGEDKRSKLLTPTQKGCDIYKEIMIKIESVQTNHLKHIDDKTLETINLALSQIKFNE